MATLLKEAREALKRSLDRGDISISGNEKLIADMMGIPGKSLEERGIAKGEKMKAKLKGTEKFSQDELKEIVDFVRCEVMDELAKGLNMTDYQNGSFIKLHMNDCNSMRQDIAKLKRSAGFTPIVEKPKVNHEQNALFREVNSLKDEIKWLKNKLNNPRELLRLSIDTFKLGEKK